MLSLLNSVEHQASQLDRPQHDSSIYGGMLITLALDGYQTMVGLDQSTGSTCRLQGAHSFRHVHVTRCAAVPADLMRSSVATSHLTSATW